MSDDIPAIRARWADVRWTYGSGRDHTVYLQTHCGDIELDASDPVCEVLPLLAAAPADVQALGAALDQERELTGELTAQQAPLADLVAAAVHFRDAVRADDIGHQCEAEDALLAAVERLEHVK